jgi:hypothetical protein
MVKQAIAGFGPDCTLHRQPLHDGVISAGAASPAVEKTRRKGSVASVIGTSHQFAAPQN